MPIPGGYWLMPSAMASWAAFSMAGGPSSSGKPWPRFTAETRAASADISANTVVAYGRSRETVMVVELRPDDDARRVGRRACGRPRTRGRMCGWTHARAESGAVPLTIANLPNQQVGRALLLGWSWT